MSDEGQFKKRGVPEVTKFMSEDERAERVAQMQADAPIDISGLLAGELVGPVSADRPPVPVWEYLDYLEAHPELSIDQLSRVRFPVTLYNGDVTVTSIAEGLAPGPIPATYDMTPQDVVRLYQVQHDVGAFRWNADTLTHEQTKPLAAYHAAVRDRMRQDLDARARGQNP